MLRPTSRQSACSASSMYRKNQLKWTIPAGSASWKWTRRRSRYSDFRWGVIYGYRRVCRPILRIWRGGSAPGAVENYSAMPAENTSTPNTLAPASMPAGSDPHKPLRDDVRLLGELLGETLRR